MSRLSTASGNWLSSIVSTLGSARDRAHCHAPVDVMPAEVAGVGKLSREACVLQGLFSRARSSPPRGWRAGGGPCGDALPSITSRDCEQGSRDEALAAIEHALHSCREALTECTPQLPLLCRRRLEDALRTLETEYVRLCDAERFLADRRRRYAGTGEADDDPEFTVVLERVVYATDQGDDVAASVAQAVQTIVAALLPHMGLPDQFPDGAADA